MDIQVEVGGAPAQEPAGVAVKGNQQPAITADVKFNKGRIPLPVRNPGNFHRLFIAARENYFLA